MQDQICHFGRLNLSSRQCMRYGWADAGGPADADCASTGTCFAPAACHAASQVTHSKLPSPKSKALMAALIAALPTFPLPSLGNRQAEREKGAS